MVISCDFDQTLAYTDSMEIIEPNTELINKLIERKNSGDIIILNTMREGQRLQEAVSFCESQGLVFDAINDNCDVMKKMFNNNPRKIYANIYIDDLNAKAEQDLSFVDLPFYGRNTKK